MPATTIPTAVHVFTFKDGLLARLAHDLRLSVHAFEVSLDGGQVAATLRPESMQVDGVPHGATLDTAALSKGDKEKIHQTMLEVLKTSQHPDIRFMGRVVGAPGQLHVEGTLHLAGAQLPLTIPVVQEKDAVVMRVTLTPSRFGIAPYKALGGAIRLQDRVEVQVSFVPGSQSLSGLAAQQLRFIPG